MTKLHIQPSIAEDAARMGFHKIRTPPDYRNVRWVLKCSKCPVEFSANWNPGTAPAFMEKNMHQRGWDVGVGMRPLCPACAHGKNKGPVAKPDKQSFERFIPPPTQIFDKLLDASNKRSARALLPALKAELDEMDAESAETKQRLKDAHAAVKEARKQAEKEERTRHAQAMRAQRLREEKERRDAQAEYARLHPPAPAPVSKLEEPSPQDDSAPQAREEVMNTAAPIPTPTPRITHAVFQCLDGVFDADKRLYKNGYTDARVAKECGTSDTVVAYLRNETFGQLAEDPRISAMRDDIDLLRLDSAETFAKLQKSLGEMQSRLEQLAHQK